VFHQNGIVATGLKFHIFIRKYPTKVHRLLRSGGNRNSRDHQAQLGLHQLALELMNVHSRKGIGQQGAQDHKSRS
jgi:hypothetical protein